MKWLSVKKPLTLNDIEKIERDLSVCLPVDYKRLIGPINGGALKDAYVNETDVTEWTREANELLIKQKVEDQVRRDIIQSTITYYLVFWDFQMVILLHMR